MRQRDAVFTRGVGIRTPPSCGCARRFLSKANALDADQKRKIAERYANGETMAQLAAEYEVGEATIFRALRHDTRALQAY
jgi:hypothetical protein